MAEAGWAGACVDQVTTPSVPLAVVSDVLAAAGLVIAIAVQRIRQRYDIETVRETKAFIDGEGPEHIVREHKLSRRARTVLNALAGAAVGLLIFAVLFAFSVFGAST